MSKPIVKTVIIFTLVTMISACGTGATAVPPTATSVPPSPSAIPTTALPTQAPPTATPELTLAPTDVPPTQAPPTATPVPTVASPSPTSAPQVEPGSSNVAPITLDTVARVERLRTLEGHDNRLYGLAFSPDGRLFGSYSLDGVVQVWDRASWQVIQEYRSVSVYGWRLFFLTDGKHIASGEGTVWDITSGEQVHTLGGNYVVTFSPDGAWMAATYRGQPSIELWRVADWGLERELVTNHTGNVFTLAFSPDSRLLATAANLGPDGPEFAVKLWDVTTGQELFTLQGHQEALHGLAFSPDGKWLATASMDTTVKIWDVQTGQLLHTLQTSGELFDVTFAPDSSLVAAALNNKTVELWDVASGQLARTLEHGGEVVSVAFAPDGALLASGAYDKKIYLWGIPPKNQSSTWTRPADGMVMLYVPGGAFDMGSNEAEVAAARAQCEAAQVGAHCQRRAYNESPVHTVTLEGFWLDCTEASNAQYALCVEDGACRPARLAGNAAYNGDDYPVAGILWQDAADYCAWAGARLPSEAEWEYAARGSERRIYPWGDAWDCAGGNFEDSFTGCEDGYAHTAPVGSFPAGASWCGVLDMAGNVWEWVADWYGDYPSAPGAPHTGPASGDLKILRGGSWGYDADGVRTAYRYPVSPDTDYLGVGLRCAASATTP